MTMKSYVLLCELIELVIRIIMKQGGCQDCSENCKNDRENDKDGDNDKHNTLHSLISKVKVKSVK